MSLLSFNVRGLSPRFQKHGATLGIYSGSCAVAANRRALGAFPDQCSSGDSRFQFTVTTHTPLHSTKLPLRV